jgi:DNA modification methylase
MSLEGVICADNLDVLGAIREGTLDLIYLDPPFATGAFRKAGAGQYDDRDTPAERLAWLKPRLQECHRVLADRGSLFLHLDWRVVHHAKLLLDGIFGEDLLVNEIVWCYSVGGKGTRSFGRKHDTILWYGRTPDYSFFPDAIRIPRRAGSHMKVEHDADGRPVQVKRDRRTGRIYRYPVDAGKIPEDYWTDIETLNRSDGERTGWPTQKPERLLERIIQATTLPGWWVADFFGGSGTTAAVASRLGRRFLSVDVSEEASAIARDRVQIPDSRFSSPPRIASPTADMVAAFSSPTRS